MPKKIALGSNNIDTLNTNDAIANVLFLEGKLNASLKMCEESIVKRRKILGDSHPSVSIVKTRIIIIRTIIKEKDKLAQFCR